MNDDLDRQNMQARGRFLVLQVMRLTGIGMVILGMLIVGGKIELPQMAGFLFIAIGFADALVVPVVLARRWKSPLE